MVLVLASFVEHDRPLHALSASNRCHLASLISFIFVLLTLDVLMPIHFYMYSSTGVQISLWLWWRFFGIWIRVLSFVLEWYYVGTRLFFFEALLACGVLGCNNFFCCVRRLWITTVMYESLVIQVLTLSVSYECFFFHLLTYLLLAVYSQSFPVKSIYM